MPIQQTLSLAPCRFRGAHPTVARPASRTPLARVQHERCGAMCAATRRGLRASSRPRLRDTRYRRPASKIAPPRRTS
ncbi:MAG TPA: hypothetical protein VJP84_04740 [Steroidobacteraceae bacterium]|nr:hypothetical protein [Steroidobacteraceae bacterium]